MDSLPVITGLHMIFTGISEDDAMAREMIWACSSTFFNVSGPYKCWLPTTNQASRLAKSIILSSYRDFQSRILQNCKRVSEEELHRRKFVRYTTTPSHYTAPRIERRFASNETKSENRATYSS